MSQSKESSEKVVYGRFRGNVHNTPARETIGVNEVELLNLPPVDTTDRLSVLEHIKATFKSLVRRPVEVAWIERPGGLSTHDHTRPAYGPYNAFIGYYEDGRANHSLRFIIDRMRKQRAYTLNAVELRCDALGLAIYVSGITQVDPGDRKAREGVRIVVYDHDNLKHTDMFSAKTPEELVDKLHHVLITTYNRLAREFNLAGFNSEFLTLKSSHKAIPDIRIDMQN